MQSDLPVGVHHELLPLKEGLLLFISCRFPYELQQFGLASPLSERTLPPDVKRVPELPQNKVIDIIASSCQDLLFV